VKIISAFPEIYRQVFHQSQQVEPKSIPQPSPWDNCLTDGNLSISYICVCVSVARYSDMGLNSIWHCFDGDITTVPLTVTNVRLTNHLNSCSNISKLRSPKVYVPVSRTSRCAVFPPGTIVRWLYFPRILSPSVERSPDWRPPQISPSPRA